MVGVSRRHHATPETPDKYIVPVKRDVPVREEKGTWTMIKAMSAVLVSAALLVFLWGCGKKEQSPTPGQPSKMEQPKSEHATSEHPTSEHPTSDKSASEKPAPEPSKSEHPEHPK